MRGAGIDAALKSLKVEAPQQAKVNYNGWEAEKKQKATVTACTIEPAEEGLDKCQMRIKEQEFKIKQLKAKMDAIAPTKKNKADIQVVKDQIELLQMDGNYRAALGFVRKIEEEERDKRREEREREEEGASKGKKAADPVKKKEEASSSSSKAPVPVEAGPFTCDGEVVAVVRSALDGSEEAQTQLKAGPGAGNYKSDVSAEVPSIVVAGIESISAKLKRAATRDHALRSIRCLLWNPPAVLPSLPAVLALLDEAKLKTEPSGTATDLCQELCKAGPKGKAVPELVLPVVLAHLGAAAAGKWKVKVGCMGLLKDILARLSQPGYCPKQMGLQLPKVMMAVRDAVGDARKEVKKEAEVLLRHMGQEVAGTPEIRAMADDIISSILDSANMEKAADALHRLANTTFMNTVDSCSFGLIFPVVSRAMREQTHDSKLKGVQIVGASVHLIADPELLLPYIAELMPLLKECLMHPTAGIQHEAAKSFGSLAAGLPTLCDEEIFPWLLEKLESDETNDDVSEVERRGAARGLTEVLLARRDLLRGCLYKTILPRIAGGRTNETKAGGLTFIGTLAHVGTQAFLSHLPRCLQTVLNALLEESEIVTKQAVAAARTLIEEYGATYPNLLLPRVQMSLFFEPEDARILAMQLFFYLCEKVGESVKFGQDFLTVEVLSTRQRHLLLSSIYIARTDKLADVRRMATLLWKERLQSGPKAKGEILPVLLSTLRHLKDSDKPAQVEAAESCLAELTSAGDVTADAFQSVSPLEGAGGVMFAQAGDPGTSDDAAAVDAGGEDAPPPPMPRAHLLKERALEAVAAAPLPGPLHEYIQVVIASCCSEASTRAQAEEAMEEELRPLAEKKGLEANDNSALAAFGLRPALDKIFDGVEDEVDKAAAFAADSDALVRVDNLRMMYGGGHLLLKDTTLELRRGRRYGVVGRNGAGKTTLMNTIASGGVSQIPKTVKTLHVRPEVLVEASDLNAVQFCKKENVGEVSEEALQEALSKVGFPSHMQAKAVNELSGGWRMKLLLASAMMRDCDILLLDEPTNHLDRESVEWLSHYLCSLTKTSLMVISHDPGFLNVVCTDIIQYSAQKSLDYYRGNFDDFRRARQIHSDEEAEALLMGRDVEDVPVKEDEDEAGLGVTASLLDKSSKISFPIPGTLKGQSAAKPVIELRNVYFAYNEQDGPMILNDINCKISLTSRVGIVGANGAGKSTLLNLLCGELVPSPGPGGKAAGELIKHRNLRLAYIAQQHTYHLGEFMNSSPYTYIQRRYKDGWDDALQKRLIEPASEEEAKLRKDLAVRYGKYGNEVGDIVGRVVRSNEVLYEVQWKNLDDPKQNTFEPLSKLKMMAVASLAKAYDERQAAKAADIDQRPLSQKEIVKHLEQFGLDEDMVLNREIGGFSAGQKSKLTLGAAFWTKPHIVALDEPTNYIDMETLDALVKGLARYKGGIIVISHAQDFVDQVCNETWLVEGGTIAKKTKADDKK